jgi:hypothetical protein
LRDDQLRDLSMETSEKAQNTNFAYTEFSEVVRQELSKDHSFEGCVDLRERESYL